MKTKTPDTKNVELVRSLGPDVVIDRTYRLEDVVEAHRYVETRQKTGTSCCR